MPTQLIVLAYTLDIVLLLLSAAGVITLIAAVLSHVRRKVEWRRLRGAPATTSERLHLDGRYGPASPAADLGPQPTDGLAGDADKDVLISTVVRGYGDRERGLFGSRRR
jgi:hypothetical protein